MRASHLITLVCLGLLIQACTEPVPVDNIIATLSDVDTITLNDAGVVLIAYTLTDAEGDDQSIIVEVCEGSESAPTACGLAFEGPGSDNTSFVPTMSNGSGVRHVFGWDVACGRVDDTRQIESNVATTYVARLRVRGASPADTWLYSPDFTPSGLGLDMPGECMR